MTQNSEHYLPTQKNLKKKYCRNCKSEIIKAITVASKWGIDKSLYSPIRYPIESVYIAGTEVCFKCKETIPVFWWNGVPFCEDEPPSPKPRTIQKRYSKRFGGTYWANTCANCGMIQGDNHLFLFQGAPMEGLPLSEKYLPAHKKDLNSYNPTTDMMKTIRRNLG